MLECVKEFVKKIKDSAKEKAKYDYEFKKNKKIKIIIKRISGKEADELLKIFNDALINLGMSRTDKKEGK